MSLLPWIGASVAIIGVIIAAANFVHGARAKRWQIAISRTYINYPDGVQSVGIHVSNRGERSITITSAFLQSEVLRISSLERVRQWLKSFRSVDKSRVHNVKATYPATISLSGHTLPAELKPGDTISMAIDLASVALQPVGDSYVGVTDGLRQAHYCREKILIPRSHRPKLKRVSGLSFTAVSE